jgi:SecD/SecF fusion protein
VYPVKSASLGETIHRADIKDAGDASDYVGGVAVFLQHMDPALSISDIKQRIKTMHAQPQFENLGYRPFDVIGVDQAAGGGKDEATYQSAVLLVRDDQTNYAADDKNFGDPAGLAQTEWQLAGEALKRETSLGSVTRFSPQISGTLKQQTIAAMFLACLAIVAYIWFRFGSLRYGLAAIGATLHDIAIALSFLAFSHYISASPFGEALGIHTFRIDLAQVAAILTLIGFSLNDTVVVFDRIRENRGRLAVASTQIINNAINQTVSRTVLTSSTAAIAVFILYLIGGPGVHGFSYTMLVGVIFGTYSSVAIASPLLLFGPKPEVTEPGESTTPVKA